MDLELVSYLKDGKYRLRTLKLLKESNYLASELARELNIHKSSMSRVLKDLKKVELIISSSNKSRTILYSLSRKGDLILREMKA